MNNCGQHRPNSPIVKIYVILLIFSVCSVTKSFAFQTVYSIQTGSHNHVSAAQNQYDHIAEKSEDIDLEALRIEKIGKYYTVRMGKIEDYEAAKKVLKKVKNHIPQAVITEAYIKHERIIKMFGQQPVEEKGMDHEEGLAVHDAEKARPLEKAGMVKQKSISAKEDSVTKGSFRAIKEHPQAVDLGIHQPDYFRKLSLALFRRGFVNEATDEMKKAVDLVPDNPFYRIELGTLYLAQNDLDKAKEEYYSALRLNPTLSKVYYYLGELFIEAGNPDMAWLAARMSHSLGLSDDDLLTRLGVLSKEPQLPSHSTEGENLYMRQILVSSNDEAMNILKRFSEGELFEDLAFNESYESSAINGGYIGPVKPTDIHPYISEALLEQEVFADPIVISTENGFHVVQRIAPFQLDVMEKQFSDTSPKRARKEADKTFNNTLSSLR